MRTLRLLLAVGLSLAPTLAAATPAFAGGGAGMTLTATMDGQDQRLLVGTRHTVHITLADTPGEADLRDITISLRDLDPRPLPVTCPAGQNGHLSLEPDQSLQCTALVTAAVGFHTLVARATANVPSEGPLLRTTSLHYNGFLPPPPPRAPVSHPPLAPDPASGRPPHPPTFTPPPPLDPADPADPPNHAPADPGKAPVAHGCVGGSAGAEENCCGAGKGGSGSGSGCCSDKASRCCADKTSQCCSDKASGCCADKGGSWCCSDKTSQCCADKTSGCCSDKSGSWCCSDKTSQCCSDKSGSQCCSDKAGSANSCCGPHATGCCSGPSTCCGPHSAGCCSGHSTTRPDRCCGPADKSGGCVKHGGLAFTGMSTPMLAGAASGGLVLVAGGLVLVRRFARR